MNPLPIDNKTAFLGKLCRNGHDYYSTGKSRRFIKGGRCTECRNGTRQRWYKKNTDKCLGFSKKWRNENQKRCTIIARQWRHANPNKCKFSKYMYRKKSWIKHRFICKKSQCKRLKIDFDLTVEFLESLWKDQNEKCYWLHIPISMEQKKCNPLTATIDRLDSEKGYIRGNVVWASYFANIGRTDCSVEEFQNILSMVKDGLST